MSSKRSFYQMVIPSVLAFALTGVYCITDGFFVGNQLGDNGLAAINLAYPITAFVLAIGTGIGLAGAVRYSIFVGREKIGEAKAAFSCAALLLITFSVTVTALIFAGLSPLLHLLGARGTVYDLAKEYTQIITAGAICQILATGLIPFVRNKGGASFAMFTMILGFGSNIALDYIFIWVFHWGMKGAAMATIIGQAISLMAIIPYLIKKRIGFSVCWAKTSRHMADTLKLSAAPFGLTFSTNITLILMNRFLMIYHGEQAVAAYACIAYVIYIAYLLLQGVGDGSQPLISRYYGEGNLKKEQEIMHLAYLTSGVISVMCAASMFLMRRQIGILFGASGETNAMVAKYMPLFLAPLLPLAYVRITTTYLYATEKVKQSYILVYAEPILLLFLLLLLPHITPLQAVSLWIAEPLAQITVWGIALMIVHGESNQTEPIGERIQQTPITQNSSTVSTTN